MTATQSAPEHTPSGTGQKSGLLDGLRIVFGITGLVSVILGILILVNPLKSGAVMMLIVAALVAVYAVVMGVVYVGSAVFSKSMKGWPRVGYILLGVLYVIAGIVLFANLAVSAEVLTLFLTIMIGIVWIIEAVFTFSTAKQSGHTGWAIFSGILSLLAGIVLLVTPLLGAVTLWILLGASLLVLGVVQVVRAFSVKSVKDVLV